MAVFMKYALMLWHKDTPIGGNIVKLSDIKEPDIPNNDYSVGDRVLVPLRGFGDCFGTIGKLAEEKDKEALRAILNTKEFSKIVEAICIGSNGRGTNSHPNDEEPGVRDDTADKVVVKKTIQEPGVRDDTADKVVVQKTIQEPGIRDDTADKVVVKKTIQPGVRDDTADKVVVKKTIQPENRLANQMKTKKTEKRALTDAENTDQEAKKARKEDNCLKGKKEKSREQMCKKLSETWLEKTAARDEKPKQIAIPEKTQTSATPQTSAEKSPQTQELVKQLGNIGHLLEKTLEKQETIDRKLEKTLEKQETIERKLESFTDLLNCRQCLRSRYKKLNVRDVINVASGDALPSSPLASPISKYMMSPKTPVSNGTLQTTVSNGTVQTPVSNGTLQTPVSTENCPSPAHNTVSTESDISNGGTNPNDSQPVHDSDLVSIGESIHGVRMKRDVFDRCRNTAKNATKYGLNLLEKLVTKEECGHSERRMTIYGDAKRTYPLDTHKRRAIRSQIFAEFHQDASSVQQEAIWKSLLGPLNNKIRGVRNGNYKDLN